MRSPLKIGLIALAAIAILGTLVALAGSGLNGSERRVTSAEYVAIGDSYTAAPALVEQIDFDTPPGCFQSNSNYPHIVAGHEGISSLTDVSCGGARISNLTVGQQTADGTNEPQQEALSAQTGLVTVGMGGNDADLLPELFSCADAANPASLQPCLTKLQSSASDELLSNVRSTRPAIDGMLSTVKEKAPNAQIFVVGYPQVTPGDGTDCPEALPLTADDLTYFDAAIRLLNDQLKAGARKHDAIYVDTYKPSTGLNACAAPNKRWIEPVDPVLPTAPMHPNPTGERGMATAVTKSIDKHLRASRASE